MYYYYKQGIKKDYADIRERKGTENMNNEWMEVLARLDEQAVERLIALAEGLLRKQEKERCKKK